MRKILVTGAMGHIGSSTYLALADQPERYDVYGLDRVQPDHESLRTRLQLQLLRWLAQSNYWNAGYKQKRLKNYSVSWPHDGVHALGQSRVDARERPIDL